MLRTDPASAAKSEGRTLRFLANVDPIDASIALKGLDPETTLVVIISKTFTTAETMLNARTCRSWLTAQLGAWHARSAACSRSNAASACGKRLWHVKPRVTVFALPAPHRPRGRCQAHGRGLHQPEARF